MLRLGIFLLCFSPLFPQASNPASDAAQVQRADPGSSAGEVRFDSFLPVDWEELAHHYLKAFSLDHPTPQQISNLKARLKEKPMDESGLSAEVSFSAPIPKGLQEGYYYALSLESAQPLHLAKLEGVMRYRLSEDKSSIVPDVFYGQLLAAKPSSDASDPAFIVFSATPLTISALARADFRAHTKAKDVVYTHVRDGKSSELVLPNEGLFGLQSVSFFKIGSLEYVLANWKPDTENHFAGCQRQYSLFVLDPELKLVTTNQSGCDV